MRVLYIEDERYLADAVKHNLEKNNIDCDLVFDGKSGLDHAMVGGYDVIILDIMLPEMSGLEVLAELRGAKNSTPVIMLSALSDVEDKVNGLNTGADDYLAKPFKTIELIARINALTRRPAEMIDDELSFADLKFNKTQCLVNGQALTQKEASLLCELMLNAGRAVKKERLLTKVWGSESFRDDNYLEVYISRLRKILKEIGSDVKISAVRGLGYKISE